MRNLVWISAVASALGGYSASAQVSDACTALENKPGDGIQSITCINQLSSELKAARAQNVSLAKRLEAIEAMLGSKTEHQHDQPVAAEGHVHPYPIPEGAILMFAKNYNPIKENETEPCPPGWRLYQPATGRFPIGAGQPGAKLSGEFTQAYGKYKIFDPAKGEMVDTYLRPHQKDASENYLFYKLEEVGGAESVVLSLGQSPNHGHAITKFEWGHTVDSSGDKSRLNVDDGKPWEGNRGVLVTDKLGDNQPHNNMPPYIALYFCSKG